MFGSAFVVNSLPSLYYIILPILKIKLFSANAKINSQLRSAKASSQLRILKYNIRKIAYLRANNWKGIYELKI